MLIQIRVVIMIRNSDSCLLYLDRRSPVTKPKLRCLGSFHGMGDLSVFSGQGTCSSYNRHVVTLKAPPLL